MKYKRWCGLLLALGSAYAQEAAHETAAAQENVPLPAVVNDEPPVALLPNGGGREDGESLLPGMAQDSVTRETAPATENEQTAKILQTPQGLISNRPLEGTLPTTVNNAPPWSGYQAAESLAANGNPDLALKQLEARLASAPDDARAAYLKGLILMQLGRSEDAERWFKMMQSNFPDLPQPYNALAVIYGGRGDLGQAQAALEALLKIEPRHQNARLNLANIHLRQARAHYEQALQNAPDDAALQERLKLLEPFK